MCKILMIFLHLYIYVQLSTITNFLFAIRMHALLLRKKRDPAKILLKEGSVHNPVRSSASAGNASFVAHANCTVCVGHSF